MSDLDLLPGSLQAEARRICHQLLCGSASLSDLPELQEDPQLAAEVGHRLQACGLELHQAKGWKRWMVTGAADLREQTKGHDLNQPQLAALAYLFTTLSAAPAPSDEEVARMRVQDFTSGFGRSRGWKADYVRRAVLGPLERMEYVRVVTPSGSRREAYIQPGPRMSLLDRSRLLRHLERAEV